MRKTGGQRGRREDAEQNRKKNQAGRSGAKGRRRGSGWGGVAAAAVVLALSIAALAGTVWWVLFRDAGEEGTDDPRTQAETPAPEAEQEEETEQDEAEEAQSEEQRIQAQVQAILDSMTLEEKVCQLFMITPEALTGVGTATQAGEATKQALNQYPVGGLIYFGQNLIGPDQTRTMLTNTARYAQERCGFPIFLSVDEEGGQVARIGSNPAFGTETFGNMSELGARGDTQEAYQAGVKIGAYLRDLGFNMDAAPDVDVLTNPNNEVVRYRSFGSDPELVAQMGAAQLQGLNEQGIIGMYKHFPGHGGTAEDSHAGYASAAETLEELKAQALVPFQDGIDQGIRVIMVSHISCPNVTGDNTPATLSSMLITDVLREQMGFDGMVITDALNMGAITDQYSPDQAAVAALNAGADMLLMPADFQTAYQGVLQAVADGTVTEERIDESVARILTVKAGLAE